MRKIATVITSVILAFTLAGCASTPTSTDKRFGISDADIGARVIMDRVTGVYYLAVTNHAGSLAITPLLNVDGLPLCSEDANHGDIESALSDVRANTQRWERGEL